MNILIFGGTQFVSQAVAKKFIQLGHSVFIFTRGVLPITYSGLAKHFIGNRKDRNDLAQLANYSFEIVIDCNAYDETDICYINEFLQKGALQKYLLISSGAVYPTSNSFINESCMGAFNPNWGAYGENKYRVECALYEMLQNDGLPLIILRPTYIYGKGNNLYREAYLYDRIQNGLPIPIPSSGTKVQFIYIQDFVDSIVALLDKENIVGEVFNLTNPATYTWFDYVTCAANVLQMPVKITRVDSTKKIDAREYFPYRDCTYLLNIDKLSEYGVPTAFTSLEEGLSKTFMSYKKVAHGLKDKKMCRVEEVLELL